MSSRIPAVFVLIILAAVPLRAHAWDCDFYEHCCFEYYAAMQEQGTPANEIDSLEYTCTMHRSLPEHLREHFCFEAWFAIGEEIYSQYERGILDFVPESCPQGPPIPDDEILEPDPAFPDPTDSE